MMTTCWIPEGEYMKKNIYSEGHSRDAPLFHILGRFEFEGTRYAIVELQGDAKNLMATAQGSDFALTFCRFMIDGRTCAIVSADSVALDEENGMLDLLTEREMQIATLVAMGRLNKQIADQLHISEWTVGTHLRRIFAKLCVDTRAAMVYRCASLIGQRKQ
jgi:DNA-binding NarL/FixJ family response regulator